jgi:hypothetical protein
VEVADVMNFLNDHSQLFLNWPRLRDLLGHFRDGTAVPASWHTMITVVANDDPGFQQVPYVLVRTKTRRPRMDGIHLRELSGLLEHAPLVYLGQAVTKHVGPRPKILIKRNKQHDAVRSKAHQLERKKEKTLPLTFRKQYAALSFSLASVIQSVPPLCKSRRYSRPEAF